MLPHCKILLTLFLLLINHRCVLAADRPNIIYILADDMGFSDIGCYGSEIATPTLDSLAANGLRFTQFYNTARCCPTRASLLTGLYPHQAGIGWMMSDSGYDGYRGELNKQCVTLAEVLKTSGYRTYMTGKWHVTQEVAPKDPEGKFNWPLQRGFDRFYGTIHGAGSFYDPNSLTRDNQPISPFADPEYQPENGYYYTDAIADHASRFVRDHQATRSTEPFFLYVAFTAAHWPMHAREENIAKYQGRYDVGYEAIRAERYQRLLNLGLIKTSNTTLWPMDASWKETEHFEWDAHNMEVYAAMIDAMDQGIGRLVATLKETGQFDNTLIMFLQDNGGCAEAYGRGDTFAARAESPSLPPLADDYIQPDMQPKQTRDGFPVRTGKGVMAGPADTYIGYGKGWATVSNTPFREYKHWTHEGGISTPLIAHWPTGIQRHGELEATPGHLIDLMATAVDVSGAAYPTRFHGDQPIKPMEGVSLKPLFAGESIQREAIYWEHEGNRAVRRGDYKLVAKGTNAAWELYNIALDRSEQNDIADSHPDLVEELSQLWQAYAERANVLPLTPYYNKKDAGNQFRKGKLYFTLKPGDNLPRSEAPYIVSRGLELTVKLTQIADGVIAAQGGVTHGWAVFIQGSHLCFATTVSGQRTVLKSPQPLTEAGALRLKWEPNRTIRASINSQEVLRGEMPKLLTEQPADGLQIGSDDAGNVGNYASPFEFAGEMTDISIKLIK